MTEPSKEPPEAQRLDEFAEVAVDGKTVFRVEQLDEMELSDMDDAAIAFFAKAIFEDIDEDLEDEYGKGVEEIIRDREPEVMTYDSDTDSWRDLFEQV
jgi:hypothetical protein